MAEVAAISSVVQLIDFSGKLLALGYGFLAKVARAPKEIRILLAEIGNIHTLLDQMQSLTTELHSQHVNKALQSLSDSGTLEYCEQLLEVAERCLNDCKQSTHNKVANLARKFKWPLNERETTDTMQQLRLLQNQLSTAIAIDTAATVRRIDDALQETHTTTLDIKSSTQTMLRQDQRERLLRWLAPDPVNMTEPYESALRSRQPGTGAWFIQSKQFQDFLSSDGMFWVHGEPGTGKTILATTIIEYLATQDHIPGSSVVYFYCDQQDVKRQTAKSFLAAMVLQLLKIHPDRVMVAQNVFEESDRDLNETDYIRLIHGITETTNQLFVVVDALDESSEAEHLVTILQELSSSEKAAPQMKLLITSRRDLNVERILAPLAPIQMFLTDKMQDDIAAFVTAEVGRKIRARSLKLRDTALAATIVDVLVKSADGLFLQAKLQLDYICRLRSDGAIKQALQNLPSGLGGTYEKVLSEILTKTPEDAALVKVILQFLSHSFGLLDINDLAHALAVQPDDTQLAIDMIATDPEDLIAPCRSLVTVYRSVNPPIVHLTHLSINEYLSSEALSHSPVAFFYMSDSSAHLDLAIRCLQYLSFENITERVELEGQELGASHPFSTYAALCWNRHLESSHVSQRDFHAYIVPRIEWFLQRDGTYSTQFVAWLKMRCDVLQDDADLGETSPLYYAIAFGLDQVFDLLIQEVTDFNFQFAIGWTPLTTALHHRHSKLAKRLLGLGADPNFATSLNRKRLTPLHVAAEQSVEDMVKMLLDAGADPHARSESQTTPFYRAARGGSLRILEMLHDAGCDVNAKTWDDWTPLMEPVMQNRVDVVKQLLVWGAHCNIFTAQGLRPVIEAHILGHKEVLETMAMYGRHQGQQMTLTQLCTVADLRISGQKRRYKLSQRLPGREAACSTEEKDGGRWPDRRFSPHPG